MNRGDRMIVQLLGTPEIVSFIACDRASRDPVADAIVMALVCRRYLPGQHEPFPSHFTHESGGESRP
jgi:hypothetical protein